VLPDSLGSLENLKSLMLQGNNISSLPRELIKLAKIEEFGLEWWQYIQIDEIAFAKKFELRNETIITNRQTLR